MLKASPGLVARAGVVPISMNQVSPGPMAKYMRDIALLLNAIVGSDDRDPALIEASPNTSEDYTDTFLVISRN